MSNFFTEAQGWPRECARETQSLIKQINKQLPKQIRSKARSIFDSKVSWEYKFFWLQSAQLLINQKKRVKKLKGSWSPQHDQLFEEWNRSEHAEIFLKTLNKTSDMKRSSEAAEEKVIEQLEQIHKTVFQNEKGSIPKKDLVFELGQFGVKKLSQDIYLNSHNKIIFESWDQKNFKKHISNITESLSLIKSHSPDSFQHFSLFSKKIIPIKQKELVSYSLQSLPGHSFINLYNRDRIDLLDDLLHENGHHHLNHFLILYNPLIEKPDLIYYSPWREARRPLRGIYHAYMTFYFAQKLFFDLIQQYQLGLFQCSNREIQKIYYRFCEETLSLDYSAKDIMRAYRAKRITKEGFELFLAFRNLDKKMAKSFSKTMKLMNQANQKKILKLKKELSLQERWPII